MDLAALEIFRAVVEEGGITRAAERLHRVQSNVTTRIRQLEASLGVELFLRDGKRMVLTPAGQTLFDYARRMLQLADEARHAVLPARPHGRLRIASMESTAASRLPAVLAAYHQAWPDVQLELVTCTTGHALQALARFEVDCAFVAEPVPDSMLARATAFEEELVIIAHAGHAAIRSAADVQTSTLLGFETGCIYRQRLEDWYRASGQTPRRILELGSYHALIACAAAGIGIAIIPRSVLALYRDLPEVSIHSLGDAGKVATLLVWHPSMASAALSALAEAVRRPAAVPAHAA
ncbi:LysR substrate-binding domain-containing protein [Cupriavidus respiraculi]|uniref:HTH-type transcriptional regulator GltR n=1 Tax=Cupriavidus respiraculi TaxID=195930 RepID=A0ABM8XDV7_9BURK|nr:LysR substrate-binding domain-containing protein [Cupriavidus respiraculi]MBY4948802.1 LysR family transcriptional regulator [Cupriavidus respiraculi]CAG9178211.1 HTH-type transcriptional regulator GltR [Cupriavidus respiraculi]